MEGKEFKESLIKALALSGKAFPLTENKRMLILPDIRGRKTL